MKDSRVARRLTPWIVADITIHCYRNLLADTIWIIETLYYFQTYISIQMH
jgi:hypothetical protein